MRTAATRHRRRAALLALALAGTGLPLLTGTASALPAGDLVISEVYGGGGNTGAAFANDFVELYNRGTGPVSLSGTSVQYASATGTFNAGLDTPLPAVTLAPGASYLVALASGGANGAPLPTPDVTDSTNMSATAGKVALAAGTAPLGTVTDPVADARVLDLVGYGATASAFEGAGRAPAPANATSVQRRGAGATDTDDNAADFTVAAPTPRGTGSGAGPTDPPTDPPPAAGTDRRIREVQGAAHRSPLVGTTVRVPGTVTARRTNGFYLQDPTPDADLATSEGLFVFTGTAPSVAVGDSVLVTGDVAEFRPGGAASANLSTTQLSAPVVSVLSSGNPLPGVTLLGTGGRALPTTVLEDDANGDVEAGGAFDPANDGLDAFESLEGMRVGVADPAVVGPTSRFGEVVVVSEGSDAGLRTPRGGIVVQPQDSNPERIILDDGLVGGGSSPLADTGDRLSAVEGVLDYSFSNYKLLLSSAPTVTSEGPVREQAAPEPAGGLSVSTFNVENLDPGDGPAKFGAIADQIVTGLQSPDVLSLEEVQDDNGPTNNGVVTDDVTLQTLVDAIVAAGGPRYDFRSIDPLNGTNGGEPGGNIRNAFLFRTDTGVAFVDRPGGSPSSAVQVVAGPDGPQLSASPGLVDPTNSAFASSRKPLAGEFTYRGDTFFLVSNHFNSKGGDQPLFGRFQPPARSSEVQRRQQATIVGDLVEALSAQDPQVLASVLGDINDFQFSDVAGILEQSGLEVLLERLPLAEQYTYVFEGNAQVLDQILATPGLAGRLTEIDAVHVNSEYVDQISDHDPVLSRYDFAEPTPPAFSVADVTVAEGSTGTSSAQLTIALDRAQPAPVTVEVATADGTARAGLDYTATTGTVTFPAGTTSRTVSVPVAADLLDEADETFSVALSGSSGPTLPAGPAMVTITDDDAPPAGGPVTIFGLSAEGRLVSFRSDAPGDLDKIKKIKGLDKDDELVGIDVRPATGVLYGLGARGGIYTLDTATARATRVATTSVLPSGSAFGVDINPAVDRLRVVSDTGQNLRVDVTTGATTVDTPLNRAGAPALGVAGAAYGGNDVDTTTGTVLYDLDSARDELAVQSPPNDGRLLTVGPLGVDTSSVVGFDITSTLSASGAATSDRGFAALVVDGRSGLYDVDLATGAVTFRGAFGGIGTVIVDLAVPTPGPAA